MDFLKKHKCVINLQRDILSVSGIEHPVKSDRFSRQNKVSVVSRTSLPSRPFVNTSDGNTSVSDKEVVTKTLLERQCIVPSKQTLRRRRRKHRKTMNKLIHKRHECAGDPSVMEIPDKERIGDGGETSNLDPDVWTYDMGSLDASADKGLARIPSSLSETTDQELVVSCIMRKRMQRSSSLKTRQIDRETDDRTQNSAAVEFDRFVARLLKNGSKADAILKMTDMSGS